MHVAPGRLLSRAGLPAPSLDLDFRAGAMPGGLTFTRASAAWAYNSSGVLTSFGTNAPRLDYDPVTLAPRGLLIEEARTNLFLNSAAGVTQSCTVTAAAHTLSFFGTGTITLTGTSTAGPLVGTGANNRVSLTFTPTAGSLTLTVSGSCTNVQLELGSFASSPIVTAGSTVTRAADVCSMPVGGWHSATEGTLAVEGSRIGFAAGQAFGYLGDGTTANYMGFVNGGGTPAQQRVDVVASSVSQAQFVLTGAATVDTVYREALAYKANDFAGCMNGGSVLTDTSGTVPTVNALYIGRSPSVVYGSGHIRRLRYFNRKLPDATLQVITS